MHSLRPYQDDAVNFIYSRARSMVLAPVGAGKTAIALTAMAALMEGDHVTRWLVLAPKRVCVNVWPVEADKWVSGLRIAVAIGSPGARAGAIESSANVVVMNYDNLQWLADNYPSLPFDGIVFDELTRLKNASGKRFKALHKIIGQVPIRIGLTGSFTSNGLEDVFGQCKIIDQSLLGRSKGAFLQQYFYCVNREYQDWTPLPGALPKVMARIKPATYLLEPGEYADKLPQLHTVPISVPMFDRKAYDKMKRDFILQFPTADAIAANAAAVTAKLLQLANGFVYTDNGPLWVSSHKYEALEDLLEENQHANTLVWYWFKEEAEELKRRFKHAQTLDSPNAVERWNKGEIELLIAHPASAGHGINLQYGGCHMVFLTLPWSLELYEQAIGRLHRSGQAHDVWVYLLLSEGTIDEKVAAALLEKRSVSDIAVEVLKSS